jgi:hypothetical protein
LNRSYRRPVRRKKAWIASACRRGIRTNVEDVPGPLDGDFGHTKNPWPNELAEQHAADLPPAGRTKLALQLVLDGVRQQELFA